MRPSIAGKSRPWWVTALSLFCALTVVFLAYRDLFLPDVRDTEVWLGLEIHGFWARLTAPLHWAIFALGAWGFWTTRPWVWPWASAYVFYIAFSHLVWNLVSPAGGGWASGLGQAALFSIPAIALLEAARGRRDSQSVGAPPEREIHGRPRTPSDRVDPTSEDEASRG